MEAKFLNLYPNIYKQDRRQKASPVDFERRSGVDRRQNIRLSAQNEETFKRFIHPRGKNDDHFALNENEKAFLSALSPIVPIRRVSSLPDNLKDGNYERAAGILGLMVFNLPEDCRDMRNSIRQIADKILSEQTKGKIEQRFPAFYETFIKYNKPYDYKEYQHSFSFFRGTWFEPLLKLPGKVGKRISSFLYKADIPLLDTKFGKVIRRFLDVKEGVDIKTGIFDIKGEEVYAKSFQGGNKFTRLVGRSMLRMSVIGIYVLALLELPAIINASKKGMTIEEKAKSTGKQAIKSAIFVSSITSGIGILGALGFKKFGATGSLVGMGIGSILGGLASKKAGDIVDKC